MDDQQVFTKVLSDAIKNVIFFGIGALVIAFIGNSLHWRTFALILAAIFAIVVAFSAVMALISFFAGVALIPSALADKRSGDTQAFKDQCCLWAGSSVRVIEEIICLGFVLYLYKAFF